MAGSHGEPRAAAMAPLGVGATSSARHGVAPPAEGKIGHGKPPRPAQAPARRRPAFEPPRRSSATTPATILPSHAAPPSSALLSGQERLALYQDAAPPSSVPFCSQEWLPSPEHVPLYHGTPPPSTLYQASPTSFSGCHDAQSSGQHYLGPYWSDAANSTPMTPTHAAEEDDFLTPMLSSSTGIAAAKDPKKSYMNLLTQDEDDDSELLQSAPTSSGKGKGRGGNYTHDEDVQLCKSWIEIGNDPITGNEQPLQTYWNRIAEHFHANRDFESSRTANSLEHRWAIILKDVMRFHACYESVERRHRSGIPYKEHMPEANAKFAKDDPKKKQCQFIHCWLIVRHTEKLANLEHNKRPSKSSSPNDVLDLTNGGEDEEEQGQETSSMPPPKRDRPPGRKGSKEKQKKRSSEGQEDEVMGVIVNLLQAKAEASRERTHVNSNLEERRLQIEERRLEWDKEQKIMFCDMSTLDEHQRAYVTAMQAQIAKAKVAALNSEATRSEHGSAGDGVDDCSSI